MGKVLDRIVAGGALWLDAAAYTERLLANGSAPWLDSAQYVAFQRKAQGLLRPDFVVLPIGRFVHAWLAAHPDLRSAMAAKTRAVVPARTLLADTGLRAHLVETGNALRIAFNAAPLVIAVASPRALIRYAWQLAFGDEAEVEIGGDEIDGVAVYLADFLRSFGESGVDGLLLAEHPGAEPANADELGWYQPVINVAAHYRWDLGLRLPSAAGFAGAADGLQFVIAPEPVAGVVHGLALPAAFWNGAAAPETAPGDFRFATVPEDAVPETILERLAALRG